MPKTLQTTIQCIQCRQPFRATFQNVIDAKQDPRAKVNLLTGRFNMAQCPNCGAVNTMLMPLIYHDPDKELLVSYVPMELGLSKDAQEKAIGDLLREVTSQIPQGSFKGYLLNPRTALTMQGLIDQILQADGVTPEMIEGQRARVRLIERFLEASDEQIPTLVQENNEQIDAQFFQTLTMLAQRMMQEGQPAAAERLTQIQAAIVELSTYGQQLMDRAQMQEEIVRQVAEEVNALGEQARREDFLNLAIRYADDDQRLQALVGLIRPVFDYTFFQELTARTGQVPSAERDRLQTLRDKLLEFTALVDQQAQVAIQESVSILQDILSSDNPDAVIEENLHLIDYTFMEVLSVNIREAERQGDLNASARLKDIYNRVIGALQSNMPPELQFINQLLSTPSEEEARQLLAQRAGELGPGLLAAFDAIGDQVSGQGNPALTRRLALLREAAAQALG